jgi:methylated-DNA-[protein]-cysteine S-methyltransferase
MGIRAAHRATSATIQEEMRDQAYGIVVTWAGSVQVTTGPAGVRASEIARWSATRSETPPDLGEMTILAGDDAKALDHLRQALGELDEYFHGERRAFRVSLDPHGTDFYRAQWAEVARVPFGETSSYAEIAQAIGAPAAVRAVGAANGANPLAPFVPCHRIVGSDGRLTGYGPGLPLKVRLLAMEGAIPASAEDYDAWVEVLSARNDGAPPVLGLRGTGYYCAPGCARSRARWSLPPRVFANTEQAREAGFQPCPLCGR